MIGINLIDKSVLSARRRRRRIQRWVVAVLIAGGVAAFPVGLEVSRHQQVTALESEKQLLLANIETTRTKLNEIGIEIRNLELQTARAGALRTKRSWSGLFARLAATIPDEIWLVALATDPATPAGGSRDLSMRDAAGQKAVKPNQAGKDAKPEPPSIVVMEASRALVLEGYALEHRNLYEFMSRLKETNIFTDVSLTKAVEEPVLTAQAVRFKVQCRW